jgi:hypothetical protein
MARQKYFYKLYVKFFSERDNSYHEVFYGDYKTFEYANRRGLKFIDNTRVTDINIMHEKDCKVTTLKGKSILDF